ncbi:hypothetical protein LO771_26860 [Streptacidiphilus sp. ASG 303]|uniref:PASTA domain-containing protein n=1 Tax=Streptacidiphilus sp. ASG 303 TaxID=2896847 RepID=UPI001E5DE89B|nr:hypothetical protein [Streptacidiphilus sp. ASG 303]MCD0485910.1 hypothetical protein [Streptacidiphilus sp. ASG 303]
MSGPLPAPSPSKPSRPRQAMPWRAWWRTHGVRVGLVAAVPVCGLVWPRLGAAALIAAVVVLWRGNPWPAVGKAVATVVATGLLVSVLPGSPQNEGQSPAAVADPTGASWTAAPSAPSVPTGTRRPLQDYRGRSLDLAYGRVVRTGADVTFHDASDEGQDIAFSARSLWKVCFQTEGGTDADPTVDFGAVRSGDPCPKEDGAPIPLPRMPELVWKAWPKARQEVVALGVPADHVWAQAAYANDTLPDKGEYDTWRVCAHDPAEGEPVRVGTYVTLFLSSRDNGCPDPDRGTGTSVDLPDRDGDGDPDYLDPFPGDRNRNTTFPHGVPRDSGDSGGGSDGHGWNPCHHTRWC